MVCIYCSHKTQVINSRLQKKLNQTWRRRHCDNCQGVFTTIEGVDWYSSLVVKKVKALEPFQRDKLFVSVFDSLKHRKNACKDATALTATIMSKLAANIDTASLVAGKIGQVAAETLKNFDHAAYTHYTAYHPDQ